MKQIPLSQGKVAMVDDNDFEFLNQFKWYFHSKGYAIRYEYPQGQCKQFFMHRILSKAKEGEYTDHINRDKLDNRKANLRLCTFRENVLNTGLRATNTSGFRGVSWSKQDKKWVAQITHNYHHINIGRFKHKIDAAKAYNKSAKQYFKKWAQLNIV